MTLELGSSWEFHKDTIRTLYIVRNEPLKDVIIHMREEHGFDKRKSQYENQFRKWGLRKNSKGSRWKDVQRKCQAREKQGKKNAVYKNGRRVDDGKLVKERRHDFRKLEEWYIPASHPKTPEGFVIHTPLGVDIPPLLVNNIPCLQLFQHLQSFARTQKGSGRRPQSSSLAISQQHFSNEESLELVPRSSELHSRADLTPPSFNWVTYFADLEHEEIVSNGYARLESAKTILARSRFQNTGKAHSLQSVLSMLYLASNNLLGLLEIVPAFEAIRECGGQSLFKAIVASKSLAVKAIAKTFVREAIASCDLSLVKAILDIGIDLNQPDKSRLEKPLETAIRVRSVEIAKLLLIHGADVNGRCSGGFTMLMAAVQSNRPELVQLMLSSGADVNAFSSLTMHLITALQQATRMGNFEIVQLLLCWGADVNLRPDPAEETALEGAASTGNLSLVTLLLDFGAHDCMSALPAAIYAGNREILQILWKHAELESCNLSDVIVDEVSIALQAAASTGDKELVNFFLDAGADVNASPPDMEGKSALQAAVYAGDLEMVQKFLDLGANVNIAPARFGGLTPLQEAVWCENIELVRFLLDSGAEINADAAEQDGFTALQAAIAVGNRQLARDLIILGADVNAAATTFGASALEAAVEENDFDLVRLILDSGANDTGHWRDALDSAISQNYDVQSVKLLLDYGFDIIENPWNYTPILALAVRKYKGASTGVVKLLLEHGASNMDEALIVAAKFGDLDHIELLLHWGADINATITPGRSTYTTRFEMTALSAAASSGDVAIVQFLLSKDAGDVTGALRTAASAGNIELAALFLQLGANVNAFKTNEWGIETTALEEAATSGNVKVLRLLLDSGAKVDSDANPRSRATALQRAAMVGNLGVVDELLQRGADVNAAPRGYNGRTALEGAAENGRLDIVQLLINVQADVQNSKALEFARREGHEAVVELLQRSI